MALPLAVPAIPTASAVAEAVVGTATVGLVAKCLSDSRRRDAVETAVKDPAVFKPKPAAPPNQNASSSTLPETLDPDVLRIAAASFSNSFPSPAPSGSRVRAGFTEGRGFSLSVDVPLPAAPLVLIGYAVGLCLFGSSSDVDNDASTSKTASNAAAAGSSGNGSNDENSEDENGSSSLGSKKLHISKNDMKDLLDSHGRSMHKKLTEMLKGKTEGKIWHERDFRIDAGRPMKGNPAIRTWNLQVNRKAESNLAKKKERLYSKSQFVDLCYAQSLFFQFLQARQGLSMNRLVASFHSGFLFAIFAECFSYMSPTMAMAGQLLMINYH
ncbi:hypothetical protein S40293_10668 [Stachybotrys chartarum IBT 40293]|nr:hypothetical protein S40293_10668 [Stachybotrys chartarum IBT 40293]